MTKANKIKLVGELHALISERKMDEADGFISRNSCADLRLSYRKTADSMIVFSKYTIGAGKNKETIVERTEL